MTRIDAKENCAGTGNMKSLKKMEVGASPTGEAPWVYAVALELLKIIMWGRYAADKSATGYDSCTVVIARTSFWVCPGGYEW